MLLGEAVAAAQCSMVLVRFDRKMFSGEGKRGQLISSLHLQCKAERILSDALRIEEKFSFIPLSGWYIPLLLISPLTLKRDSLFTLLHFCISHSLAFLSFSPSQTHLRFFGGFGFCFLVWFCVVLGLVFLQSSHVRGIK